MTGRIGLAGCGTKGSAMPPNCTGCSSDPTEAQQGHPVTGTEDKLTGGVTDIIRSKRHVFVRAGVAHANDRRSVQHDPRTYT